MVTEKLGRPTQLALLTAADVERLELAALLDGSTHIGPPGFGPYDPPPPYDPGPQRRPPKWARGLVDDPCSLRLVE
ncbi:MAG: hypothetical protein ACREX3_00270 [Gammaproteobacteria bacterium]